MRSLVTAAIVATVAAFAALAPPVTAAATRSFPPQFYVSTGTTIPLPGVDPVAQSGAIYFDSINNRARIDNFWMGNTRSFIVDMTHKRGWVVNNDECATLRLTGELARYGVPPTAARDADLSLVRGAPVVHYSVLEKDENLQQVDFYVRMVNYSYTDEEDEAREEEERERETENSGGNRNTKADAEHSEGSGRDGGAFLMPWRIQSVRVNTRREIAPPPFTNVPNWRFFGEPMDELVVGDDFSVNGDGEGPDLRRALISELIEDVPITIDFYNFVPMQPEADLFVPPLACPKIDDSAPPPPGDSDEAPASGDGNDFSHDVHLHHAQRLLVDLSFNTAAGRRVMKKVFNAGGSAKAVQPRNGI